MAPIGHENINMNGIITFDLARHGPVLLGCAPITGETSQLIGKS
jgi:hypothetical protein